MQALHSSTVAQTCRSGASAPAHSGRRAAASPLSSARGLRSACVVAAASEVCPVGNHVVEPPSGVPNTKLRPVSDLTVSSSKALEAFRASGGANRACPFRPEASPGKGRICSRRFSLLTPLPASPGYASEPKSSIVTIGLSIHNTPVEIRERLAIAEANWPDAIGELCSFPHVEEAAVLSTCNRMEIYFVALSYNRGVREVEEFLAKVRTRTSVATSQSHGRRLAPGHSSAACPCARAAR